MGSGEEVHTQFKDHGWGVPPSPRLPEVFQKISSLGKTVPLTKEESYLTLVSRKGPSAIYTQWWITGPRRVYGSHRNNVSVTNQREEREFLTASVTALLWLGNLSSLRYYSPGERNPGSRVPRNTIKSHCTTNVFSLIKWATYRLTSQGIYILVQEWHG